MPSSFSVYLWRDNALFVLLFLLADKNIGLLKDAYVQGDARIFIRQCRSFRCPIVDPWVANILAVTLLVGLDGISDENDEEAISLLRKVTSIGGCPSAWHSLGVCYLHGIGMSPDRNEATRCFLEGAKRGCLLCRSNFHDIPLSHNSGKVISQL